MSVADPLAISAAAPTPALSFAVVNSSEPYASGRRDSGGEFTLDIQHSPSKNGAKRHYVKVSRSVIATSPTSGLDSLQTMTVSMALAVPAFGFSIADQTAMYELLDDVVRAATLAKILNLES